MFWFCIYRRKKERCHQTVTLKQLLEYVCRENKDMVLAGVACFKTDNFTYKDWIYNFTCNVINNNLTIEVIYPVSKLILNSKTKHDCAVCFQNTNDTIICCSQKVCQKCLQRISNESLKSFNCPLCRKDLRSYKSLHVFTHEKVSNM
jgi:hypothetical protein